MSGSKNSGKSTPDPRVNMEPHSDTSLSAKEDNTHAPDVSHDGRTVKTSSSEAANSKRDGVCGVCVDKAAKYKCTKCSLRFCSVACGKSHKATHPDSESPAVSVPKPSTAITKPDQAQNQEPENRFSVLERDRRVVQLFIKYPDLEDQLAAIEKAARPSLEDRVRMGWNSEIGKQKGLEALRSAKDTHPGVEEFAELVTHLLSNDDADRDLGNRLRTSGEDEAEIRRLMVQEDH